jgi:hypothetical protein
MFNKSVSYIKNLLRLSLRIFFIVSKINVTY